jgi:hypothetical protein
MTGFIHRDRIVERLEIARTIGLVTDFSVGASGPARRAEASVEAWRHPGATDEAVKDYLIGLLGGLVAPYQIAVKPPFADQPDSAIPSTSVRIDPVPVAA